MRAGSYRYTHDGDSIRVVIAGDVIALPEEGWAMGGFGSHISEEWLDTQAIPRIPGDRKRRRLLVRCVRLAMDEHHKAGATGGEEG